MTTLIPSSSGSARIARVGQDRASASATSHSAIAMVAFIAAFAADFPTSLVTVTVVALVLAIVILPVPIVFGYGVRAAEREERGGGRFH